MVLLLLRQISLVSLILSPLNVHVQLCNYFGQYHRIPIFQPKKVAYLWIQCSNHYPELLLLWVSLVQTKNTCSFCGPCLCFLLCHCLLYHFHHQTVQHTKMLYQSLQILLFCMFWQSRKEYLSLQVERILICIKQTNKLIKSVTIN